MRDDDNYSAPVKAGLWLAMLAASWAAVGGISYAIWWGITRGLGPLG